MSLRPVYLLLLLLTIPLALCVLHRPGTRPAGQAGRVRQRLGGAPRVDGGLAVWLHAASVGEVQAASPLVDALLTRYGDGRVGVTTMTATGAQLARQRWGARVHHSYLPFDLPWFVNAFLDRWQPRRAIMLESELWPSLYRALARRRIPLLVANARMSPRSRRRYARLGTLMRDTVASASAVAAQAAHDADSYAALGAQRVEVTGNLKLDCQIPASEIEAGAALRAQLGTQRPVWIAASTREGEEDAALAAHRELCRTLPDALLILVPRHPQRFDAVARLIEKWGFAYRRRSAGETPAAAFGRIGTDSMSVPLEPNALTPHVFLGDSMGEMFRYLAAADLAFVGGSLVPIGGHNVLEPAALSRPVLFGPYMDNQLPARALLLDAGGGREVADAPALAAAVQDLLLDRARAAAMGQAAQAALAAHAGATARVLRLFDAIA